MFQILNSREWFLFRSYNRHRMCERQQVSALVFSVYLMYALCVRREYIMMAAMLRYSAETLFEFYLRKSRF